jgi:hypothetical protein
MCPPGKRIELPTNRSRFYEWAFFALFDHRQVSQYKTQALEMLVALMQSINVKVNEISLTDFSNIGNTYVERHRHVNKQALESAILSAGILRAREGFQTYEFLHNTFMEWLLAKGWFDQSRLLLPSIERYW